MRWSDGEPFTADDFVFWFRGHRPQPGTHSFPINWLVVGGEHATMGKVDDYTVRYTFAKPYGLFLGSSPTGEARAALRACALPEAVPPQVR